MMKDFRTVLRITSSPNTIGLKSRLLTVGSCFADAIGDRLTTFKLNAMVNPFGVIYNPESIHKALSYAVFNEPLPAHTFLQHDDVFYNYNFHSSLAERDKGKVAARLTGTIGAVHYCLKDADFLLITYGTAFVYQRRDTGEIVANCHKLPQQTFSRSLLTAQTIATSFRELYAALRQFNPALRIILTVSPVRHLRETLELNSVSKSILRVACHQIAEQHDDVEYFPAYELLLDDLRDYRFYKEDMLHPTTEAEEYIWERFMERYFSETLRDFVQQWKGILSAIRHKPFHPGTPAHQQFLQDLLQKLQALQQVIDVQEEVALIKKQIIK